MKNDCVWKEKLKWRNADGRSIKFIDTENSISNSAIIHTVWNLVMVTSILHITTEQGYYGNPILSIIIPFDNVLLTGAGFGVEASIIAIVGYACICAGVLLSKNSKGLFIEGEAK